MLPLTDNKGQSLKCDTLTNLERCGYWLDGRVKFPLSSLNLIWNLGRESKDADAWDKLVNRLKLPLWQIQQDFNLCKNIYIYTETLTVHAYIQ